MTKPIQLLLCLIILSVVVSCQSKFKNQFEKNEHGLSIHKDSIRIQVEVINPSIIHVKKIKLGDESSALPDYVTVLKPQNVSWELKESEDLLTLRTDSLEVTISSDGIISYSTKANRELLSETEELTYIQPEGDQHKVSQGFVAGDEALYGLGQFQSGIMNWKHVPIRLQQYNQEIAIPFVVSTKGYGIYWHNYSLTDFNSPQHEIIFEDMKTVTESTDSATVAVEGEKEDVAAHIKKSDAAEKNIRETTFTPTKTGEYTFLALSDHGGRMRGEINVSIDGDAVINYSTIWMPRRYSGKKHLEAGKTYQVIFQNSGAKIPGNLYYNEPDYNKTVFSSTQGQAIDYYMVQGVNPEAVISQYQKLTGTAPLFAKSAYGFWQCRERYHNQEELLVNAREMRERQIPFDNIVQDWFYWPKGTKGPEWDPAKYPDPDAMVSDLKALNLKLMVSVWPEVKNEALEKKYNLKK
ncbi:TIM-barrel domain-containing protein [Formosa haliotis]|uniref:TIM-barrel domain-containing protein n=1 Tax=Formosa haliotis TaxID=1555194 RepID=UPI000825F442|nr:TIM-barrel domain-containing protein [Formosa haliotis]